MKVVEDTGHWASTSTHWSLESELVAILGKHTRRSMLIEEFDLLWKKQAEFHPESTEEFAEGEVGQKNDHGIEGVIFFQRKMYWRASTVGRCELEPKEQRRRPWGRQNGPAISVVARGQQSADVHRERWVPLSPEQRTKLLVLRHRRKQGLPGIAELLTLLTTQGGVSCRRSISFG